MIKSKKVRVVAFALPLLAVTACIDNNYDLSDINTDVAVEIKDLTIPVQIDEVMLSSIIKPDDDSKLKEEENRYVFLDEGDFESDEINVKEIHVKAPASIETTSTFKENIGNWPDIMIPGLVSPEFVYDLKESIAADYEYSSTVDTDIEAITSVKVSTQVSLSLLIKDIKVDNSKLYVQNLKLRAPNCLKMTVSDNGKYNPETGVIEVPYVQASNNKLTVTFVISEVNLNEKSTAKFQNGTFSLKDNLKIIDGELVFANGAITGSLPKEIKFTTISDFSDIDVNTFSGSVKYDYNMSIDPIKITGLPDFLNGEGTKLTLANPQIYLNITNPLYQGCQTYSPGMKGQASLTITPKRGDYTGNPIVLPSPIQILNVQTPQNFCLSPSAVAAADIPAEYAGAMHVEYPGLRNVLDCNGIPDVLNVDIDRAGIPSSKVTDFPLGVNLGIVKGKYQLVAPVALGIGSEIVYSSLEDGWGDEELDKLEITLLAIEADVTNNTPFEVELSGYPVNENGNQINGVTVESTKIPAGQNAKVTIKSTASATKPITHLDGFNFTATLKAANEQTLSPKDNLVLKNVRAKVSGRYVSDF